MLARYHSRKNSSDEQGYCSYRAYLNFCSGAGSTLAFLVDLLFSGTKVALTAELSVLESLADKSCHSHFVLLRSFLMSCFMQRLLHLKA